MAIGDAERIRKHLIDQVALARRSGEETITVRAGDVHSALDLHQSMPSVCQVMEGQKFHLAARVFQERYIQRPPSGRGANLVIEYRIL